MRCSLKFHIENKGKTLLYIFYFHYYYGYIFTIIHTQPQSSNNATFDRIPPKFTNLIINPYHNVNLIIFSRFRKYVPLQTIKKQHKKCKVHYSNHLKLVFTIVYQRIIWSPDVLIERVTLSNE